MTTLTTTTISTRDARTALPTVSIAGVDWPLYKLQAIAVGVLLALVVGIATESGELSAWALTLGTAIAWWTRRAAHTRRT